MPKVRIFKDERYPDYDIADRKTGGMELDITDTELAFIIKAKEDYEKAQDILMRAYTISDEPANKPYQGDRRMIDGVEHVWFGSWMTLDAASKIYWRPEMAPSERSHPPPSMSGNWPDHMFPPKGDPFYRP